MFKRIFFYGCSITSGFELSDSSNYNNKTEEEIDNLKRKMSISEWLDFLSKTVTLEKNNIENKKLAWPAWLCQNLNVECINRAIAGGNNQSSIYLLEEDLSNGNILKTDLIIIGHTENSRYFWIDQTGDPKYGCIGGAKSRWPSEKFHDEFVKYLANDYHLTYQWYHNLKYLDLLSINLENRLIQTFCYRTFESELKKQKSNFFKKFEDYKNFKSILYNDFSFDNLVDWQSTKDLHGYTHPKVKFHKLYADFLTDKIKSFYL
jgi:hypothetical protein